ncbi:hypothetical protein GJ699_09405 [Duganella sp. FT80W]|uniref:Lipoprotein transmembrane n=1 Tax=Duganella guangzhouensis TaxID=2666084 RepID=A0A6I2L1P8_9BURK|nr:hypothetical protein [Duganella guangzhouensis]MRW90199.1 hypothetical protein [Duganella guangzhouensis]
MKPLKFLSSLLLIPLILLSNAFAGESQTVPSAGLKKVLLVVRMEGKSLPIDQKIQQHLASRGYAVTVHSQYDPIDAALDTDLVILSSTVRSRDLLGAYRNVTAPMLTWESDLLDDLGMTAKRADTDFGKVEKERYVWLVNAPHPLAAGLPAGVLNVYEKPAAMNWGKPGLGAATIATVYGQPDKAVIFGYEKGATMDYESLAPARRVMFFLDNETFTNLSPSGLKLFDAAVDWAMGSH